MANFTESLKTSRLAMPHDRYHRTRKWLHYQGYGIQFHGSIEAVSPASKEIIDQFRSLGYEQ